MVEPHFSKKAKKPLFFKLFVGLASIAVLTTPLFAQAGMLSIFTLLFEKSATAASASDTPLNSQTMALLAPAVNLDPNPAQGGGD
ncbi:MAG TPA: hypothetical protein VG753_00655, partial [Candidatus Paceibacterota bacterium]|nr:hypothetical protein [Candidatus Paceibacterota bacterium]